MNIIIIERKTMYLEKKMYMLKLRTQMSSFKIEATGILNNARKIQKSITKAEIAYDQPQSMSRSVP